MSIILKIVPVPPGTTRSDITQKIPEQQILDVEIDETDHIAYVKLRDDVYLEKLAAQYGDDLKVPDWMARMEILEDFNWEVNKDLVRQKMVDLKDKAVAAASEVRHTVEGLAERAAEKSEAAADKVEEITLEAGKKLEEIGQAVEKKAEAVKETVKDIAETVSTKAQEGFNQTKEAVANTTSKLAEGAANLKSSVISAVDSSKEKLTSSAASFLERLEQNAEPIEPISHKRRGYLIEFVLMLWLFSWMI